MRLNLLLSCPHCSSEQMKIQGFPLPYPFSGGLRRGKSGWELPRQRRSKRSSSSGGAKAAAEEPAVIVEIRGACDEDAAGCKTSLEAMECPRVQVRLLPAPQAYGPQ